MSIRTLKEIDVNRKFESLLNVRRNYLPINLAAIQDDELLSLLEVSKADMLAYILLNNLEEEFLINKLNGADNFELETAEAMCRDYFEYEYVRKIWEKEKLKYNKEFRDYIDSIIPNHRNENNPG